MDITIIEIIMESTNGLFLRITDLKIVDIYAVLVDLAAWLVARTEIHVATAASEALVDTGLKVVNTHLGRGESELLILTILFQYIELTCLNVVDDSLSITVTTLGLFLSVVMWAS